MYFRDVSESLVCRTRSSHVLWASENVEHYSFLTIKSRVVEFISVDPGEDPTLQGSCELSSPVLTFCMVLDH